MPTFLPDKVLDGRTCQHCIIIVSYFAGTDVFMSLNKPIITIFLTPKKTTVFMQNIKLLFQMLARMDGHI